jgi:hypothetical protein
MRECKIQKNSSSCSCTYEPCPRKGVCCDCIQYHWPHQELPACFFPTEVEKTYDRSLQKFLSIYKK